MNLLESAIPLYFQPPGNTNQFLETAQDCEFQMTAPDGTVLRNEEGLWEFVQDKKLVISKTTFILTSKSITDSNVDPFAMICNRCRQQEYMTAFGTCLYCESIASPSMVRYLGTSFESQSTSVLTTSATQICAPATSTTVVNPLPSSATMVCPPTTSATAFGPPTTSTIAVCPPTTSATAVCSPTTSATAVCPLTPSATATTIGDSQNPITVEEYSAIVEPLIIENATENAESQMIKANVHRGTVVEDLMNLFKTEKVNLSL